MQEPLIITAISINVTLAKHGNGDKVSKWSLLQNSFPPPLTGGGEGVGELSSVSNLNGTFPPTLTLPRQGGGDVLAFCKRLVEIMFVLRRIR